MNAGEPIHRQDEVRRFGSFAVAGGIAALTNLVSRYILSHFTTYELAVAIAYLCGMIIAFLLTRRFVFAESGRFWGVEFGRFTVVNLASLIQVWILSVGLARLLFPQVGFAWHPEEVAHFIGVASPIATSYYAHKHFSFKGSSASASVKSST
jgi:putative flippase GtrA